MTTPWQPRPYPQLLRGPRHRWWRPLVSLAIVLGGLLVIVLVSTAVTVALAIAGQLDLEVLTGDPAALMAQPGFLLLNNLVLAALIPIAMVAVWGGHLVRPRWLGSVAGGIRWRWLAECTVISLVVMVAGYLLLVALDGWPTGTGTQVALLLAIVLLTTPLQAAGEEYLFRGWLTQTVGSWFARPVVGALVAGGFSATLFAMAHGSQNVWLFLDRFAFGAFASYLVWRTGGLEAAVAAHTVNNVVVFVPVILTGGLADSFAVSDAPAGLALLDVATLAVLAGVLVWWARLRSVSRLHKPPPPPPPVAWEPPPPARSPVVGPNTGPAAPPPAGDVGPTRGLR